MGVLSDGMKKAGWPMVHEQDGSWTVYASGAKVCHYYPTSGWSVPEAVIASTLQSDLKEIEQGRLDPMRTLSRTTALEHPRNPSQPVMRICREGLVKGKRVLHLGTGLDCFAHKAMLDAGATLVNDYDPNFYPDRSVLEYQYDVVVCNYVLNILPPNERKLVYEDIERCTDAKGSAFICVQGKWPVINRHRVVGEFADGYLIRDSSVLTFRKGYDPQEFVDEICQAIKGDAGVLCMFYNNSLVQWHPRKQD